MHPKKSTRPGIRAAKAALKQKFDPEQLRQERAAISRELTPGFRERLWTIIRSSEQLPDFHEPLVIDYLSIVTGTAWQTAARWIDSQDPGLPDLVSLAMLCKVLGLDATWMLGLREGQDSEPQDGSNWLSEFDGELSRVCGHLLGRRVLDDANEPDLRRGDWVLIDGSERTWGRSGMYVLEYKGIETIRAVDMRIGTGWVLTCRNPAYGEVVVKDDRHADQLGISVLGRVVMKIAIARI